MTQSMVRVIDCHVSCTDAQGERLWLLLCRAEGKAYAGDWRMVGGKIAEDEPAWFAAVRELREETGLTVLEFYSVPYVNQFYEWQHDRVNVIPVFVAVVPHTEPQLDNEHTEFGWFSTEQALKRLPWPAQRQGLAAASQLLDGPHPSLREHLRVDIQA